jgi:hypothetical protein
MDTKSLKLFTVLPIPGTIRILYSDVLIIDMPVRKSLLHFLILLLGLSIGLF